MGGAAHSFGLEALAAAGLLTVDDLAAFLQDYLDETGTLEAAYCAKSCVLAGSGGCIEEWLRWNMELGARRVAREPREGSAAMGRRFLKLAATMSEHDLLMEAIDLLATSGAEVHLTACFGLVAGTVGVNPELAAAAYLQQSVTALVSACQRLLPLGQTHAQQILWSLKSPIVRAVERGIATPPDRLSCFTPLLDLASSRHATLYTRLFMS
jgi:urease accessory protein